MSPNSVSSHLLPDERVASESPARDALRYTLDRNDSLSSVSSRRWTLRGTMRGVFQASAQLLKAGSVNIRGEDRTDG